MLNKLFESVPEESSVVSEAATAASNTNGEEKVAASVSVISKTETPVLSVAKPPHGRRKTFVSMVETGLKDFFGGGSSAATAAHAPLTAAESDRFSDDEGDDSSDEEANKLLAQGKAEAAAIDQHREIDAIMASIAENDSTVSKSPAETKRPQRRASLYDAFFGSSEKPSTASKAVEQAPPQKQKTEQELTAELAQKIQETSEELAQKKLKEKQRLEQEPAIAKALRKAFADASNVFELLKYFFHGRRFGNIKNSGDVTYLASLEQETQLNDQALYSMNLFKKWKLSVHDFDTSTTINSDFDFLTPWTQRTASLSKLWNEVFRYYATSEDYIFSLQPLEKLRYFLEEFNALMILERQFSAYMKKTSTTESQNSLETKQYDLEHFIKTVNLFSARTMTLYKLLDGLKTQMERTQKMQRQLQGVSKMEMPGDSELIVIDSDHEEEQPAEKPDWLLRLEAAIAAVNVKVTAAAGYAAQKDEPERFPDAETHLKLAEKELALVKVELEAAKKEAQIAGDALAAAQTQAKKIKAAQAAELAELSQKRREDNQKLKELAAQANIEATQFLMEYAAQPEAAEDLTLSEPVQAFLSTVSTEMLQLWLSDQDETLSTQDAEWLWRSITPSVKELTMRILVTEPQSIQSRNSSSATFRADKLNAAILLEDNANEMLEVLSISLDDSARNTLAPRGQDSLSFRTANAYATKANQTAQNLLAIKTASSVSERATTLLTEIAKTKIEYEAHTHPDLKHMNKKTFALFGLYLLLYLQDAPLHNFTDVDAYDDTGSSSLPGAGSRFLRILMKNVQKELGYHLRHCKVIYDAMNERSTPAVEEKITTARSSLFAMKASEAHEDKGLSVKFSSDLEYIFNTCRKDSELKKTTPQIVAIGLIEENEEAQNILVRELTGRYLFKLDEIAKESSLLPEVERKRMKRIMDLIEQLPYTKRQPLMNSPIVQLFILRQQVEAYRRSSEGKKRSVAGSLIAGFGRSVLKATGTDRKEDKFRFFEAIFNYLKSKYTATTASSLHSFVVDLYQEMTGIEECVNIVTWLSSIIDGVDAPNALMWLPNAVLDEVLLGAGVGAGFIRNMRGVSEETFNDTHDSGNNSVDEEVASNTSVIAVNELMIVLAFQAAVLSFNALILTQKNEKLIVIASQHSWFLQLRFWQVIMVANGVLPEFVQGHTAAQNRILERNMLKIIDNMMGNVTELADDITRYFSQTDSKALHDNIDGMPALLKIKLAFVLVTEFFTILFNTLASVKSFSSADKAMWKSLTNYFKHVKTMAGFTLNAEYEAMLFALAVNFLFENPTLLANSRIEGCLLEDNSHLLAKTEQTKCVISNKDDSSLDASFFNSSAKITLVQESEDIKKTRLSTNKAASFVYSITLNGAVESITLQHALNSKR